MSRKQMIVLVAVLAVAALVVWRWQSRPSTDAAEENTAGNSGSVASVTVAVARAQQSDMGDTMNLAGAFKPFQDVDVHAKVAGYIRHIYVDVGSRVKEGQLLAVLEVPELTAQLSGAEAAVRAAQEQIGRAQGDVQRAESTR